MEKARRPAWGRASLRETEHGSAGRRGAAGPTVRAAG